MNKLISICWSLLISNFLIAQDTTRMNIGLEASPTIAYIVGLQDSNTHFRAMPSYSIGVHFQYNFNPHVSLKTGLQFDVKGIEEKLLVKSDPTMFFQPDSLTEHTAYNQLQYFQLPVIFRLTLGKKFLFNMDAGLYVGVLLSAYNISPNVVLDGFGGIVDYSEDYYFRKNLMPNFNQLDLGGILGLGISYDVHPKLRLSLSIRQNLGFYHIGKFKPNDQYYLVNSTTQFLLGVSWNFFK